MDDRVDNQLPVSGFRVTLSQEELTLLHGLSSSVPMLGLDPEPVDMAAEPRLYDAVRRGLQARGLLQPENDGAWLVEGRLLRAIEVEAYPVRLLTLSRWRSGDERPELTVGYLRHDGAVLHQRPAYMLHSLEYFPAPQTFYERLLALLALPSMDLDPTAGAVRMAETEWSLVRSAVERGDAGAASALLAGAGMSSPVAQRLVWLLGGVPELAVLALVDDPGLPARRTLECTLLLDESGGIGLLTQPDEGATLLFPATARLVAETVFNLLPTG